MNDDFDTPIAFSVLHDLRGEVNRTRSPALAGQLRALAGTIGFLQADPETFLKGAGSSDAALDVDAKIAERNAAKKARDFPRADSIRKELEAAGAKDIREGGAGVHAGQRAQGHAGEPVAADGHHLGQQRPVGRVDLDEVADRGGQPVDGERETHRTGDRAGHLRAGGRAGAGEQGGREAHALSTACTPGVALILASCAVMSLSPAP
jgi:hypothetical protein